MIDIVDVTVGHEHVAVASGCEGVVAFDDDGAAAIDHRLSISVDIRAEDVLRATDHNMIGELVNGAILTRTT
jgi:hypothetical protein